MLSRLTSTKSKIVSNDKSRYFRTQNAITDTQNFRPVVFFGGPEEKGDTWELERLNINYGLQDDPVDENIEWALYWADPVSRNPNKDTDGGYIWSAFQHFRVLTSVGVIIVSQNAEVDLSGLKSYENSTFDNENLFIGALSSANSSVATSGNLLYRQRLVQRQMADDFSEYESGFLFEEASDEEEGDSS